MTIQQVTEHELDNRGVRCVAVPSLEWNGIKYVWLTSYASGMESPAQKRCQDLCAGGRAALVVRHSNGDLTIWQGPTGSAQPVVAVEPQEQVAEILPVEEASPTPVPQPPEPQPEESPQPRTVTMKYRGKTITKQVGPTEGPSQEKGQRSYRGRKY